MMNSQKTCLKTSLLASSGVLLFSSCAEAPTSRPVANSRKTELYTKRFQHVKHAFYRDKAGQLFEQRQHFTESSAGPDIWYDSMVVQQKASGAVELPLATTIDLATYEELENSLFSKDKNRVYYSYANSGGGFRCLVNSANPATFRASPDYQYGFDDKHGFFCAQLLPGLRVRRRQLLYGDSVAHFIAYVKDDQRVFYQDAPIAGADAPTFHLVRGRAWEAEDKNHRYKCGGQRID